MKYTLLLVSLLCLPLMAITQVVPDVSFQGDGIASTSITFGASRATAATSQSGNKIVAVGVGDEDEGPMYITQLLSDGSPDLTFAGDGSVSTRISETGSNRLETVLTYKGVIYAGGRARGPESTDFAIVSFNADGSANTVFNGDGKVLTNMGVDTYDEIMDMAIDVDGKIVVGGYAEGDFPDFAIARYNLDGSLDNTFGTGGKVVTDFTGMYDYLMAMDIQSDDKIVAMGYMENDDSVYVSMARYNTDGSLDNTFGNGGLVLADLGSDDSEGYDIKALSDSRLIVAAEIDLNGQDTLCLARFNSDGSLDMSYANQGKAYIDLPGNSARIINIERLDNDSIMVGGVFFSSNGPDVVFLAKFDSTGVADPGFGLGGIKFDTISAYGSIGVSNMVRNTSNGYTFCGDFDDDFSVWQYQSNGNIDSPFGGDGKILSPSGTSSDFANDMVYDADSNIVMVGAVNKGGFGSQIGVARFKPNGDLDSTFGTNGTLTLPAIDRDARGLAIAIDTADKLLIAGHSYVYIDQDNQGYQPTVWRLNPNGTPDSTYGVNGTNVFIAAPRGGFTTEITLLNDGSCYLTGDATYVSGTRSVVALRVSSSGVLDSTFGENGIARYDIGNVCFIYDAILQPDSLLLIAGRSSAGGFSDALILRVRPDGTRDSTFGNNGVVISNPGGRSEENWGIQLLPDGNMVVGGILRNNQVPFGWYVMKYDSFGTRDLSFGDNGIGLVVFQDGLTSEGDLIITQNGKYVITGTLQLNGGPFSFGLCQFNSDGTIDSSFNGDGTVNINLGVEDAFGTSVLEMANGQLQCSAWVEYESGNFDFGLVRFIKDDFNTTYVPDDAFEQHLIDLALDDVLDNYVLTEEISDLTSLDLSGLGVSDLTGLLDFRALLSFDCSSNSINAIDVKFQTSLEELNLASNDSITTIGFGTNSKIHNLNCNDNKLTSLDLAGLTLLDTLHASDIEITSLDLSANDSLRFIDISDNALLSSLNIANGNNNAITFFDATNDPLLRCINVDDNVAAAAGSSPYDTWLLDMNSSFTGSLNRWTSGTGSWDTPGNWSLGHVPYECENVEIDMPNASDVITIPSSLGDILTGDIRVIRGVLEVEEGVNLETQPTGN